MHQITGDPKYREWGWTIFQSFEKHLKTTYGYGSLRDVRRPQGGMMVSADPGLPPCFLSLNIRMRCFGDSVGCGLWL